MVTTPKKGYRPKVRNSGTRKRKKLLIISAEGKNKTETRYFKQFAGQAWRVIIARGNDTDPLQVAQHLIEEINDSDFNQRDGDLAYAFVDHDLKPSKDAAICSAEKLLEKANGELMVSNPCFEIWFLAHLQFTTKDYHSSQEVINDLSKRLGGYSKDDPLLYAKLKDKTNDAICNAQRMEDYCRHAGYVYHKHGFAPSTDVYKAIISIGEH